MNQSVYDACLAAITGLTLGSPHVGRFNFQRLTGYSPIPHRMNAHASLDAWLIWQKAAEDNKSAESLGQIFLDGLEDHTDETAYGLMNLRRGFGSPLSGHLDNPLASGSRALLRSLIWAFLKPDDAAYYAYFDASIDHADEGVWLPAALAHAVATLHAFASASQLWEAFSAVLPQNSVMHRVGPHLFENQGSPEAAQIFSTQFSARFPGMDRQGIVASTSFVLVGLIHSGMDSEKAMLLTAGCGGQADLTTATSAAIGTYLWGLPPADYINTLDNSYVATHSLKHLTPPESIEEFATLIASSSPLRVVEDVSDAVVPTTARHSDESQNLSEDSTDATVLDSNHQSDEGQIAPDSTNSASKLHPDDSQNPPENATVTTPTDDQEVKDEATHPSETSDPTQDSLIATLIADRAKGEKATQVKSLLAQDPNFTTLDVAGIQVTAQYIDTPVGAPPVKKLNLTLKNQSEDLKNVKLSLTAPNDWQVASRVTDSAIPQNTETSFPAVIKPPINPGQDNHLRLQLDKLNVLIPYAAAQRYWLLGPFVNIEGTAFTQVHPPEKSNTLTQSMNQAFSGRSDLGIRWQEQFYSGTEFDVEPLFNQGPGAAFLYAHVSWPAGIYRIHAAFAGGLKIWIDGKPIISYNDSTRKPANHPNYSAEFSSPGESRILIKIIRSRDPIPPLHLTFFDESGRIVFPTEFTKDD